MSDIFTWAAQGLFEFNIFGMGILIFWVALTLAVAHTVSRDNTQFSIYLMFFGALTTLPFIGADRLATAGLIGACYTLLVLFSYFAGWAKLQQNDRDWETLSIC